MATNPASASDDQMAGSGIDGNDPVSLALAAEGGDPSSTGALSSGAADDGGAADLGGGDAGGSSLGQSASRGAAAGAGGGPARQTPTLQELAATYGHDDLAGLDDDNLRYALFNRLSDAMQMAAYGPQYQQPPAPQYQPPQGYSPQQPYGQYLPQGYGAQPQLAPQMPAAPQLPQWNTNWDQYLWTDPQTGQQDFKPYTPPQIRNEVMQFAQWQEQMRTNPAQALAPFLQANQQQIYAEMQTEIQRQIAQNRSMYDANSFMEQNDAWMFQHDNQGNRIRTYQQPEGVLSVAGAEFVQNVNLLARQGVQDPYVRRQLAAKLMVNRMEAAGAAQQQQAAQQDQRANQASRALHNTARKLGGRGNSVRNSQGKGAPPQGTARSLREALNDQLDKDGFQDNELIKFEPAFGQN